VSREAWVVFDLGFGDAGKGATVDFLVRDRGASLVVRWGGGAQAGHTVTAPDGRQHTFSQLGAGSFVEGTRTHLGPEFVFHPGGFAVEARVLSELGVEDALRRTSLDARALVISPFQQAAGRLRELLRGDACHGTCGVGVGECVGDALRDPAGAIRARDLAVPSALAKALRAHQERKRSELSDARHVAGEEAAREWSLLCDDEAVDRVMATWEGTSLPQVVTPTEAEALLTEPQALVFEGAQGVLLDQWAGFHPHTTWSDCTPRGALRLLGSTKRRVRRLGVLRTYATRHGAGPFPTHDPEWDHLTEPHNSGEGWQGSFRRGPLDLVLLRYALEACGGADGLALTHMDRFADEVPVSLAYRPSSPSSDVAQETEGQVVRLVPAATPDLRHQERLTELLSRVRPLLSTVPLRTLPQLLEERLGVPVLLEARGPSASERRWTPRAREGQLTQ
jgi:adenylosuccinate synthase